MRHVFLCRGFFPDQSKKGGRGKEPLKETEHHESAVIGGRLVSTVEGDPISSLHAQAHYDLQTPQHTSPIFPSSSAPSNFGAKGWKILIYKCFKRGIIIHNHLPVGCHLITCQLCSLVIMMDLLGALLFFTGVVAAVVFTTLCAMGVIIRFLYQHRRPPPPPVMAEKKEHRGSLDPHPPHPYRTEPDLHKSTRDHKEYFI